MDGLAGHPRLQSMLPATATGRLGHHVMHAPWIRYRCDRVLPGVESARGQAYILGEPSESSCTYSFPILTTAHIGERAMIEPDKPVTFALKKSQHPAFPLECDVRDSHRSQTTIR